MRRFSSFLIFPALLALILTLPSCGGGTPKANVPAAISVPLSTISLNKGDVYQLSPTATDKNGTAVLAQYTFSSDTTTLLNVSTNGSMCAGTWDTNFIVCTPTTANGSAKVTISTGGISTQVTVFVHEKVDSVQIDPLGTDCISSAGTAQLAAKAFSSDAAACTRLGAGAPPCEIPPSALGTFFWTSNNTSVVTFDNNTNIGKATANVPGTTTVYATAAANNSPAVKFTTCPLVSLSIATSSGGTAPFSLAKAGTQALVATAIDSKNTTLTNIPVTWVSSQSFALTVAATSTTPQNATVTANNPGTASISATCSSPACNIGLDPIYSNLMIGSLTGTSNDTLYVASKDSVQLVPVDLANNNSVGTAVTLPQKPNSMVASRDGNALDLGSDSTTAMSVNPTTNAVTNLNISGTMLGFSPDSALLAFQVPSLSNVSLLTVSNLSAAASLPYTGTLLKVGYAPDSHTVFLTQGNNKLVFANQSSPVQTVTLGGTANDNDFLATGHAAYLAGGAPGQITARATCSPFDQVDSKAAANPQLVRAIPDGSGMLVLDPPNIVVLSPISADNACPTNVNSNSNSYVTGISSPTAILVTPDSSKAFITDGSGSVYIFNLSSHTTTPVALSGVTATYQADLTLDSKYAYVGTSDGKVHKIDLAAATDVGQIDPKLKQTDNTTLAVPHFVALRHKP
jgi:hypothetical protein